MGTARTIKQMQLIPSGIMGDHRGLTISWGWAWMDLSQARGWRLVGADLVPPVEKGYEHGRCPCTCIVLYGQLAAILQNIETHNGKLSQRYPKQDFLWILARDLWLEIFSLRIYLRSFSLRTSA